MQRIKFSKTKQRIFLDKVMKNLDCPSLRALNQFGFDIPYPTLKNYYTERRLIPESLFKDFLYIAKIPESRLKVKYLNPNLGQIKGGKQSKQKVL